MFNCLIVGLITIDTAATSTLLSECEAVLIATKVACLRTRNFATKLVEISKKKLRKKVYLIRFEWDWGHG